MSEVRIFPDSKILSSAVHRALVAIFISQGVLSLSAKIAVLSVFFLKSILHASVGVVNGTGQFVCKLGLAWPVAY